MWGKRPKTSSKCCPQILTCSKLTWNFKRLIDMFGETLLIWLLQASCYQILSLNIEDFLCTYELTVLVTWCSITATSDPLSPTPTQTFPKKKLIRATKKITLYLHICVLVQLHTGECLAPDLRDFTVTTGILFSAEGTPHLSQTGPAQCYRMNPCSVCVGGESTENHFFCKESCKPFLQGLSLEKAHPAALTAPARWVNI